MNLSKQMSLETQSLPPCVSFLGVPSQSRNEFLETVTVTCLTAKDFEDTSDFSAQKFSNWCALCLSRYLQTISHSMQTRIQLPQFPQQHQQTTVPSSCHRRLCCSYS